jgi:type I restriction enzyme, S subunit
LTDRSNRARAALADIPKLIEQFRQSVLAAAFRGDLTADWREKNPDIEPASELLKRIRVDSFSHKKEPKLPNNEELVLIPESWIWITVEHIGIKTEQTVLTGPFGANLGSEDFRTSGVPVITI